MLEGMIYNKEIMAMLISYSLRNQGQCIWPFNSSESIAQPARILGQINVFLIRAYAMSDCCHSFFLFFF